MDYTPILFVAVYDMGRIATQMMLQMPDYNPYYLKLCVIWVGLPHR